MMMITSCEYGFVEFEQPEIIEDISFANDIVPIFNNKCNTTGCHSVGHFALDLSPENAYEDIINKNLVDTNNPELSVLYVKISQPGTHDNRSVPSEQLNILQWIKDGAKDN